MVARTRRDHAARALLVSQLQQRVERPTLLVGGGELLVLELEPDLGPGNRGQRLRMQRRRTHDGARDAPGGGAHIVDGQFGFHYLGFAHGCAYRGKRAIRQSLLIHVAAGR